MKKLLERTGLKALAFFLFCALAAGTLLCAAGYFYCWQEGWYRQPASFAGSGLCRSYVSERISEVAGSISRSGGTGELDRSADGDFSYTVTNSKGRLVADTRTDSSEPALEGWTVTTASDVYSVTGYINLPVTEKDGAWDAFRAYSFLSALAGWLLPLGIAGGALSIALFVFLMAAAGRRKDGAVELRGLNRWPLDLYVFLSALPLLLAVNWSGAWSWPWSFSGWSVAFAWLALAACGALCLGVCVTFAARVKAGKWWRNTLVYIVCRFLCRMIGGFFRALPLAWKAVLTYCGFTLVNVLFTAAVGAGGAGWLLALFPLDLAGLYAVVRISLQLRTLQKAGRELAAGDLAYTVDTGRLWLELKEHGENLNSVGLGMSKAVTERLKSERFKTELITNVSHDLKTPLTSIVTYVDLLKKEEIPGETARGYIEVLDRQSARLKKLTEDLVEASKASSGVLNVNKEKLDLAELLRQSVGEYAERFAAAGVEPVVSAPEGETPVCADGRLLWRVLDNLLLNITKYAQPGTRAYLDVTNGDGKPALTLKNISREPLNIPAEELMERFVRGDASRSTEGSGLGLSIAQSLMELMGGKLALTLDGDLFKATLTFGE